MRLISSCFNFTQIPLSICFVILLKKLSIIFSHDPCSEVTQTQTSMQALWPGTLSFLLMYVQNECQV